MRIALKNFLAVFVCAVLAAPAFSDDSTLYVQAVKASLKKDAKMDSATVVELKRGDELKVLKRQDPWVQVSSGGKSGWISKLFVAATRPVGAADLAQDAKGNIEKASRRRSSSYAVSASTRALTTGNRVRDGRELYQADFDALAAIDTVNVSPTDLDNFQKSAKLSQ